MKVLSFLEFYNLSFNEKTKYLNYNHINYAKPLIDDVAQATILMLEAYNTIVKQPFKPELILVMFEEWELSQVEDNRFVRKIKPWVHIEFYAKYTAYYMLDILGHTDATRTFNPLTLDDFINDCKKAGIELTWRVK
jgi:hypothetical protein